MKAKNLQPQVINNVLCVDARAIHERRGYKSRFRDWIKSEVKRYHWFNENEDYFVSLQESSGGRKRLSYAVSVSMAMYLSIGKDINNPLYEIFERIDRLMILNRDVIKNAKVMVVNNASYHDLKTVCKNLGINTKAMYRHDNHFAKIDKQWYVSLGYVDLLRQSKELSDMRQAVKKMKPIHTTN